MKTDPYEDLASGLEYLRDALRATVAGIIADGFTEEQAREIATAIFSRKVDG